MEKNMDEFVIKNGILKKYVSKGPVDIVEIPNIVSIIGKGSFENCHGIDKLIIPNSVKIIEKNAFKEACFGSIIMGNNVEEIGESAFEDTHIDTCLKLSKKLKRIKDKAFCYFKFIHERYDIEIPSQVEEIGADAFSFSEFTKITLPSSIKKIGEHAFEAMEMEIKELEIPFGISRIPEAAFSGFTELEKLKIPDEITEIGESAFSGCEKLNEVIFSKNLQNIGSYAFDRM